MDDQSWKIETLNRKLEWPVRILFTIAIIFTLVVEKACEQHFYPLNAFLLTILALWAYFFKQNWVSAGLLLFQCFLAYTHALQ